MYQSIVRSSAEAEDTLLIYFAGHGRIGSLSNELHLCAVETDPDFLPVSSLRYADLREVLLERCNARNKLVVLDCCFSGRAIPDMSGGVDAVVGQTVVDGTYVMTATASNALALAPSEERFTAFTGALIDVLSLGTGVSSDIVSCRICMLLPARYLRSWAGPLPVNWEAITSQPWAWYGIPRGTPRSPILGRIWSSRLPLSCGRTCRRRRWTTSWN